MTTPRYVLAKYVPNLLRFEPRNIGVIVWSPDAILARFAGEKPGVPGEIDGRTIPSFITSPSAYRQWVRYWRATINKTEIPRPGGPPVPRTSPDFIETLKTSGRGEFLVTDGGFLLDEIPVGNLSELADYLFTTLVEVPSIVVEVADQSLDEVCESLIGETRLAEDKNLVRGYSLECPIKSPRSENLFENFKFSYGYKNGEIRGLFHQVPLSTRQKTTLKKSIHDSAWMFEKVINADIITYERSGALIYAPDDKLADPDIRSAIAVLSSAARVINVANREKAADEFRKLTAH